MSSKNALIIFAKPPRLGRVKTRLAAQMGDAFALDTYLKLLRITQRESASFPGQVYLYATELDSSFNTYQLFGGWPKRVQPKGDLGEKIFSAFYEILSNHSRAVLIGSDLPQLQTSFLKQALHDLETHDLVLGPSVDGGYYLIALKAPHRELFEDIRWSSSSVLESTLEKAAALGLSYSLLPEMRDIDTLEDLEATDFS